MLVNIFRAFGILLAFLTTLVIYSYFPAEVSSNMFVYIGIVQIAAVLCKLGFDESLLKHAADERMKSKMDDEYKGADFNHLCRIMIPAVFIALITSFAYTRFLNQSFQMISIYFGIISIITNTGLGIILQGRGFYKVSIMILHVIPNTLIIMLLLISSLFYSIPYQISNIFIFSYGISSTVAVKFVIKNKMVDWANLNYLRSTNGIDTFKLIKSNVAYWVNAIASLTFLHIPVIIADVYLTDAFVADLAFALKVSQIYIVISVIINFQFMPNIRSLYKSKKTKEIQTLYLRTSFWALCSCVALTLLLFLAYKLTVELGMLTNYRVVTIVFTLSCGTFLSVLLGPIGALYVMADHQKRNMLASIVVLFVGITGIFYCAYFEFENYFVLVLACVIPFSKLLLVLDFVLYYRAGIKNKFYGV